MEKMTKRDYFNTLLTITAVAEDEALVAFVKHEIELLDKKNAARKGEMTETQKENAALGEKVLAYMATVDGAVTIADVRKQFGLNPQKVTPLMETLEKKNKVTRTIEKRVSYFTLV